MQYRQIIATVLVLVTLVVFWRTLSCQFVGYDDDVYINPHVRQGVTANGIAWAFSTGQAANYHPLTWLSLMADTDIFGPGPRGYHLTNLLLHALAVLLLYLALEKMTGDPWRSGIVVVLFALHPLRVESVAWVSERKDVLSGCLAFATLLAYVGYARRPALGKYLLVLALLGLGLLAKPMLVTLPVLFLLLDVWPLRRTTLLPPSPPTPAACGLASLPQLFAPPAPSTPNFSTRPWRTLVLEKLPLIALALVSCIVTMVAQHRGGALRDLMEVPLAMRLTNVPIAYVRYLGKMVWFPNLMLAYPLPSRWPLWWVAGAAVLLAGISILAARGFRRRPWLGIGWLWYLGMLLPVIGIVQVGSQSLADRYTYLPTVGLLIMAAWSLPERMFVERSGRWALNAGTLVILALLSAATWRQIAYWHDEVSLFTHSLQIDPDNQVAVINLAVALDRRGDIDQEWFYVLEAQSRWPDALTTMNVGHVLLLRGKVKQAMSYLLRAVEMAPDRASTHNTLGGGYAMQGRPDLAIVQFRQALAINPEYALAHYNLGDVLGFQHHYPEALAEFAEAMELDPDDPNYFDTARTLAAMGHPDQAVSFYLEALQRRPEMAQAYAGLGNALVQLGQPDKAIQCLEKAIALDPKQSDFRNWLALAKTGKRPVEMMQTRP